ncbi:MAG: hypothetical protein ACE5HS_06765 [bacterium]
MRKVRSFFVPFLLLALLLSFAISHWGCSDQSPLAPQNSLVTNAEKIHFIPLTDGSRALSKGQHDQNKASAWVTVKEGGKLKLKYKNDDVKVKVKLQVRPKTINRDAELTLVLNPLMLDMEFGPADIIFSSPAMLNIEAKGLDLSKADPDKIDIYYVNPLTNKWEKIAREKVKVDIKKGSIKVVNAEIEHFSRYAVGWGE